MINIFLVDALAYVRGEGNYIEYGYDEINAQIKALHDLGIQEYILWDPKVKYPEGPYDGNMAVPET